MVPLILRRWLLTVWTLVLLEIHLLSQGRQLIFRLRKLAVSSYGLKGNAILVQKESPIKSLQDLKGKKVGVAKGSSGFNLLYRAIDKAGLKPEDVEIIQFQPDEALPAFESVQLMLGRFGNHLFQSKY